MTHTVPVRNVLIPCYCSLVFLAEGGQDIATEIHTVSMPSPWFRPGIRDILVRIRIRIQLRNRLLSSLILEMQKKFHIFFLITCPQAPHLQSKKCNFLLKFCVKILFCRHYFSPLNTFMRKGKDPDLEPEPDPDPYLWLMDLDPGGPKTCGSSGSGSPTLVQALAELVDASLTMDEKWRHRTVMSRTLPPPPPPPRAVIP